MKALTMPEIDALLSVSGLQLRAMVRAQFYHAMRASEITGLLRSDVDLDARTILVRRLKGSKTTLQPIRDEEYAELSKWLAIAPKSLYCFPARSGTRLARLTYYRWFREAATIAGIPKDKRFPHATKHGCAMALIRGGMGLAHVQKYLGHANISSTMCYLALTDDDANAAADKVFERET